MKFNLTQIDSEKLISLDNKLIVLYADFNVLNYLYENKIQLPASFIFYPDSTAVYFALKYLYKKKNKKIVSTDMQQSLLEKAVIKNKRLFFFGDSTEILNSVKKNLKKKFHDIYIVGELEGYYYNNKNVIKTINECEVDILFIGLGVTRQEKWIINNYQDINAKKIIAVGGWFQYIAENKKRASKNIRAFHLEWFVKLIREFPFVWKRYFIGIPLFFYRIYTKKIQLLLKS